MQLINKDQIGGTLTPLEFNRYAEFAQREYVEEMYNRNDGMGYESTYDVSDFISAIKENTTITVQNGTIAKPSNYLHYSSAYINTIFNDAGAVSPIELVRDDEWAERLASQVNKPSKKFPIMRDMGSVYQLYPQDINNVNMTYLREPLEPWWNYTLSGSTPIFAETGGITTNPNSGVTAGDSTDFEIQEFEDLVWKICKYIGIEIREGDLFNLSNAEQKD